MTRRDRIAAKIKDRCLIDPETGCWLWQGPTSGDGRGGGYGRFSCDGGTMATHIAMWICEHGPIPPRKQLDHTDPCRNRRNCCNPAHLELVTHKENMRRRDRRAQGGGIGMSRPWKAAALAAIIIAAAAMWLAVIVAAANATTLDDINRVNRQVNREIRYQSDQEHYGTPDLWVIDPADHKGDCEDYALTKMARLLALGVPYDDMSLRIVRTRRGQAHAVLEVRLGGIPYILDYADPWATPRADITAYTFGD